MFNKQGPPQHTSVIQVGKKPNFSSRINLVSTTGSKGKVFLIFSTFTLIALILGTVFVFIKKKELNTRLNDLSSKKQELTEEYESLQNQALLASINEFLPKITSLDKLLNSRKNWTKLLDIINQESLRQIKYTSITFTDEKTIELAGEVDDYETYAKAIKAWQGSDKIKKITVGAHSESESSEGGESAITFSLSIEFKPEAADIYSGQNMQAATSNAVETANPPIAN